MTRNTVKQEVSAYRNGHAEGSEHKRENREPNDAYIWPDHFEHPDWHYHFGRGYREGYDYPQGRK